MLEAERVESGEEEEGVKAGEEGEGTGRRRGFGEDTGVSGHRKRARRHDQSAAARRSPPQPAAAPRSPLQPMR